MTPSLESAKATLKRWEREEETNRMLGYEWDVAEALRWAVEEIEHLEGYKIAARDLNRDLTEAVIERDAQAARIAELEDALVEGLTNFLHYRASCYDPARRCPYAKECDDCSTWDACGHVEMFRSEARRQLQAEGKIGPDAAKPQSWQITEERKAAIDRGLQFLEWSYAKNSAHDTKEQIAVLWAMLDEDTHGKP